MTDDKNSLSAESLRQRITELEAKLAESRRMYAIRRELHEAATARVSSLETALREIAAVSHDVPVKRLAARALAGVADPEWLQT